MILCATNQIAPMVEASLVVADTSVWIEWLTDGLRAAAYAEVFADPSERVLVPSICIYEVARWYLSRQREKDAQTAAIEMQQLPVIELSSKLARDAALFSVEHRIAMADAIIFATAQARGAELWTQDADFAGLPGVRLFPKP
jgi:toxin FitB